MKMPQYCARKSWQLMYTDCIERMKHNKNHLRGSCCQIQKMYHLRLFASAVYPSGFRRLGCLLLTYLAVFCCFTAVAQDAGNIRLIEYHVHKQFEMPVSLQYQGFSSDGNGIAFLHRPKITRPSQTQDVWLYSTFTGENGFSVLRRKSLVKANLYPAMKEGYHYDLQPWNEAFATMQHSYWLLSIHGRQWQRQNTGDIAVSNVHLNRSNEMVFGHVCYPFGGTQGIESGLYRWFPKEQTLDSLHMPRKHLYIGHIKSDNAWSALLNDSICLMADITQYRLWMAGGKGEAKELKLTQPLHWAQYPDSSEARYNALVLIQGEIRAWDTLRTWFEQYSRIEKIMANSHGDVLIRYTAKNASGKLRQYFDVYQWKGDSLEFQKTLPIGTWPDGSQTVTKENFSSVFLGAGTPTFLMNDRRLIAFHVVPEGKTWMGLRSKEEIMAFNKGFNSGKLNLAVYVYRFD